MKDLKQNRLIKTTQYCKIELKKLLLIFVLGMAVQIAASFILTLILERMPEVADRYQSTMNSILQITPGMIFSVCLLMPILEEIFFRGIILGSLRMFIPFIIANITQALAFGIYHGNIVQGIYAFILGLFIGWIIKLTGNIMYTCIMHIGINTLGMFIDRLIPMDSSMIVKCLWAGFAFIVIVGITMFLYKDSEVENGLADCK